MARYLALAAYCSETNEPILMRFLLLHLHEIVEGLYFHFSLSVSLSVCLSVRSFLVNKIPAERMNRFGRGFR